MIRFLKDWTLILAILAGIGAYLALRAMSLPPVAQTVIVRAVEVAQPLLLFAMLLLTFCKAHARELRLTPWHLWLLCIQGGLFALLTGVALLLPAGGLRVVVEGAMLCLICPTATAAAVVTRKLGGNVSGITAYTILINTAAAICIPAAVPLLHPEASQSFLAAAGVIMAKVFPLLLFPLAVGLTLRRFLPRLADGLTRHRDLPFYLWAVSLALATAVTARSIVHTTVPIGTLMWLVVISLACCLAQFWAGRRIGRHYGESLTAGQALGQKNTVLAIWAGYTFFTPVTAVVGGFYSIWHNVINTYQLRKAAQQ